MLPRFRRPLDPFTRTLAFVGLASSALASACSSHPRSAASTQAAPAPTVTAKAAPSSRLYPATRISLVVDTLHGVPVPDPYRWLEDGASPEVQAWARAQDEFARESLDRIPIRAELRTRLGVLMRMGALGAPVRKGKYTFFGRREPGAEKSVVYVRTDAAKAPRVLIDPNHWEDDTLAFAGYWPSFDGHHVAYGVSKNNKAKFDIHVMDVDSGASSEVDVLEGLTDSFAWWSADNKGFYYRWSSSAPSIPAPEVPAFDEVRYHRLGEPISRDARIREPTGNAQVTEYPHASRDGHWLFLSVETGFTRYDVHYRDLRDAKARWLPLIADRDATSSVVAWRDVFYLHTNDGAPRGRVFRIDPKHPERQSWREIVPERRDATLAQYFVIGGKLILLWSQSGTSRLEIRELDGSSPREVALPAIGTVYGLAGDGDRDEAHFMFTNYTHPPELYGLRVSTAAAHLVERLPVQVDPDAYVVEQLSAAAKDGVRVPYFLVRGKNASRTGDAPTMLTGYGGFGEVMAPFFSAADYAWLERGGIVVDACVRGGGEEGDDWHRAGMLRKKENSFDDFIAVAEELIRSGWTRSGRLAIQGASNGGLLVTAAAMRRPDLFGAVLAGVPLTDMIRYPQFGNGKQWVQEYGSPDDPEDFRTLLSYSPYHRVKAGTRYPPTLVLGTDSDDLVDGMHTRKLVAALQAATTGGPVLMTVQRNAGHMGSQATSLRVEEVADMYAFAWWQLVGPPSGATPSAAKP